MKIIISFLIFFGLSVAHAKSIAYKIDSAHSHVGFTVKHLGIIPVHGSFKKFEGHFMYDNKTKMITGISIKIDVDSIFTNEENRDAHLKSKDFFGVRNKVYDIVEKNRYITFKAKKAKLSDKKVKGKLKILKTTKNVSFKASMNEQGNMLAGTFTASINRNKYGLTWQKPGSGLLKKAGGKTVGDIVTMNINLLAKKMKKPKK